MKKLLSVLILLLSFIIVSYAQSESTRPYYEPEFTLEKAVCWMNVEQLLMIDQQTTKDKLIIIISHLGKSDNPDFGKRRLHNAKMFFTKYELGKKRSDKYIVTAEGEKADNEGYLDFFVDGKLKFRIFFRRNGDFLLWDCYPNDSKEFCSAEYDKNLYPCYKSRKIKN